MESVENFEIVKISQNLIFFQWILEDEFECSINIKNKLY